MKIFFKTSLIIAITTVSITLSLNPTQFTAQGLEVEIPSPPADIHLPQPKNIEDTTESGTYFAQKFIPKIFGWMIAGSGVWAIVFLIIGGIQFLTSYGNETTIGNAKKTITYALIGLTISLLSYTIFLMINNLASFFNPPPDTGP